MTTVAPALDATASRQIDVREIEAVPTPPGLLRHGGRAQRHVQPDRLLPVGRGSMSRVRLLEVADAEELSRRAATEFVRRARGRRFSVVLAGGSTPRRLYQLLAHAPYREQVDWTQVEFFFGDERDGPARPRGLQLSCGERDAAGAARPPGPADPPDGGRARRSRRGRGRVRERRSGTSSAVPRPRSIWSCSGWAPTAIPPRCSPARRHCPRGGGGSSPISSPSSTRAG